MMARRISKIVAPVALAVLVMAGQAAAQPADLPIAPATTDTYPPGVRVLRSETGPVYANARGQVLYGMDMRTLLRWGADPSKYCKDACAERWEPLLAPAGVPVNTTFPGGFGGPRLPEGFINPSRAPDWSVIEGAQGPQWVYKGWHAVFVRRDARPGDTSLDGSEGRTWNTLKFIPPVPKITAPGGVTPQMFDGAWALADKDGRLLYTGKCTSDCDRWQPLAAGLASRGMGEWRVSTAGERAQWLYRGKPVFVSEDAETQARPAEGKVLRP